MDRGQPNDLYDGIQREALCEIIRQRMDMNRSLGRSKSHCHLRGPRAREAVLYSEAMSAPRVGDQAPEIVLSDSTGEQRRLSSLAPCVLIFYRGHW